MLKRIAMISLGAAIVLAPLTALAQTDQSAAPAASAPPAGRTRARRGTQATRVEKERRHRPSICFICDTRPNLETAQLSWIDTLEGRG